MPAIPAEPGRLVGGRYRLTGKIGEGGMGAVYKGFDQVIGRHVALKMLGESSTKQKEKPRAAKKRRERYNDDGVPLIMP
jgi:eukaryotic-like serine/threonine-protein kinase